MSNILFGYYGLGLRALNAAQTGLSVAGDNIANINTPGFSRRRMDLVSGAPLRIGGDYIDQGVEVSRVFRAEDRFLQASLERERGGLGRHDEKLRGLRSVESIFGEIGGVGISSAYNDFSTRFSQLAAEPEDVALRRGAVAAADLLAKQIRGTYDGLQQERLAQDRLVASSVDEINSLATRLAELNDTIQSQEAGTLVASGPRDERSKVVERLAELTGGAAAGAEGGRVTFSFAGGPTLVTGARAVALTTARDSAGLLRVSSLGRDITDNLRGGRIGAQLEVRDESIADRLVGLDKLARHLIVRGNAITSSAFDLNGAPGVALFQPDPAPATGAAGQIRISAAVLADPSLLAISKDGAPGDGSAAADLAAIQNRSAILLGRETPSAFLADLLSGIGSEIAEADVGANVSEQLVADLQDRRQAVTGVSLDEEAISLIRYQRAYEAAARFIQVLNEVTEIAVNLR